MARRGLLLTGAPDWTGYAAGFHAQHAGITEDVLEHACDSDGMTALPRLLLLEPPSGPTRLVDGPSRTDDVGRKELQPLGGSADAGVQAHNVEAWVSHGR